MMSTQPAPDLPTGPARSPYVRHLFARIATRYDLLNDLMTAGWHRRWKRLTAQAARPAGAVALDVGTGTGDLALELARHGARRVVGADMVPAMVALARAKATQRGATGIRFLIGDALDLPFPDQTFDCLTSGFLVRNVADPALAFAEMYRVLKPGGRVVCLETSRPRAWLGRWLLRLARLALPLLGRLVARDGAAYAYLPASTAAFADAEELSQTMRRAGFSAVGYRRLALGLATIHQATRARPTSAAR